MSEGEGAPRDVPSPRPVTDARRRRRGPLPPDRTPIERRAEGPDPDEPSWKRERREDAEFRARFGDWQGRPVRRGPPLVLLLAVVAVLVVVVLLLLRA